MKISINFIIVSLIIIFLIVIFYYGYSKNNSTKNESIQNNQTEQEQQEDKKGLNLPKFPNINLPKPEEILKDININPGKTIKNIVHRFGIK